MFIVNMILPIVLSFLPHYVQSPAVSSIDDGELKIGIVGTTIRVERHFVLEGRIKYLDVSINGNNIWQLLEKQTPYGKALFGDRIKINWDSERNVFILEITNLTHSDEHVFVVESKTDEGEYRNVIRIQVKDEDLEVGVVGSKIRIERDFLIDGRIKYLDVSINGTNIWQLLEKLTEYGKKLFGDRIEINWDYKKRKFVLKIKNIRHSDENVFIIESRIGTRVYRNVIRLKVTERETTETTKTKKTKDPIDRGRPNEVFENLHPKGLIVGVVVAVVAVFMFAAACCYYKRKELWQLLLRCHSTTQEGEEKYEMNPLQDEENGKLRTQQKFQA